MSLINFLSACTCLSGPGLIILPIIDTYVPHELRLSLIRLNTTMVAHLFRIDCSPALSYQSVTLHRFFGCWVVLLPSCIFQEYIRVLARVLPTHPSNFSGAIRARFVSQSGVIRAFLPSFSPLGVTLQILRYRGADKTVHAAIKLGQRSHSSFVRSFDPAAFSRASSR